VYVCIRDDDGRGENETGLTRRDEKVLGTTVIKAVKGQVTTMISCRIQRGIVVVVVIVLLLLWISCNSGRLAQRAMSNKDMVCLKERVGLDVPSRSLYR
jgi:hypothetical protein